jgi:hypothetical protein
MVSRLVFFFYRFITCFFPAEPDFSIKAGAAVPERAPLDAAWQPGSVREQEPGPQRKGPDLWR